jgi:transmembrane sensor
MTDKGRILAFPDAAAIEAEAAAWVARFDAGDVSARDQAAFQAWLNRSALHREAIAEFGNLWSEMDGLGHLTGQAGQDGAPRHAGRAFPRGAMPWVAALAASLVAVAGGTVLFFQSPQQHPLPMVAQAHQPARISYETAVGGHRRIALADGSSIILNTNSRLEVDFSGNRRNVHLLRGEAYFEVVHDKTRPFTVFADNYVVRDIGTAFDVHLSKTGRVEVGVTRGSVEVAPAGGARAAGGMESGGIVAAGHNIVLGETVEAPRPVSSVDMKRKLAWRQGELIYTGQPLREVLADVSRYSNIQIELADPALEDLPVGGAFRTDQIDAIFAALENNFGVRADWVDPHHVRFTAAAGKTPARD